MGGRWGDSSERKAGEEREQGLSRKKKRRKKMGEKRGRGIGNEGPRLVSPLRVMAVYDPKMGTLCHRN